ncbi:helix-turn-helix transcriptional regulator [Mesorhizobium sp. YC-39]|uniref:helix-turn-helix domain-containing protein n=1 Tax=unclassified Mesorhizobium TaxID=325217 RepID=UPI0021E7E998|nr:MULTISPECIES: helix-turn-helix transcriptional regulator [unclassified Mesorhizobium]MCV3205573.1 helix-turn-helix transcriptional regulator [Mesorhizobium sp. YC-2]MCV3228028.1 helix-turn-helix transcriptional regulator [Mesorhizobium sp. YC-39]
MKSHISGAADKSEIAKFLDKRIYELRSRKSQREIAKEIGFPNDNFISMLKSGKAKVPLDRVVSIAKALESDPRALFLLALLQDGNEKDRAAFQEIMSEFSENEREIIGAIRKFSNGADPKMSVLFRRILRALFGGAGGQKSVEDGPTG